MNSLFLEACAEGNLNEAKRIVEEGFQPGTLLDIEIWRLLKAIFKRNDLEFTTYLFPSLLDPNSTVECENVDTYKEVRANPACIAVYFGSDEDLSILQYLLECGASVNSTIYYFDGKNMPTYILIDYACPLNRPNTFKYLMTKGAEIQNLGDSLRWCCIAMNFEIIRLIIEDNPDFEQKRAMPLQWTLTGSTSMSDHFQRFVNDIRFLQNAKGMRTHMSEEKQELQFEIVKYLLQKGADPNSVLCQHTDEYLSAGHCVSRGRKIELYKMLLQHGLDINRRDYEGRTALYYTIMGNDTAVIQFILENGGSIGDTESQGDLLEALTVTDMNNHTFGRHLRASSFSCFQEYNSCKKDVIQFLYSHGVNLNYIDLAGHTLLDRMLGVLSFYGTMCWFVKQDIIINISSESRIVDILDVRNTESCRLPDKHYVFTDVLLMAGVQCKKFMITHFENAIMMNNIQEYEALMHSNHHVLYSLNLSMLIEKLNHLLEYEKTGKRSIRDWDMENLMKLRREKSDGGSKLSVYERAKRDIQNTGTLKQLAASLIRGHLLSCGHMNSLYHVIQTLSAPKALKDILSLESIVDFETKLE